MNLWVTVILYVVAGTALIVLGTPLWSDALQPSVDARLQSSTQALQAGLTQAAEQALQAAAELGSDGGVRSRVLAASPSDVAALDVNTVRVSALGSPSVAFAVDKNGKVVAAGGSVALEDNVMGNPVVADVLTGVKRDGLVVLNGEALYFVGIPLFSAERLAGAVLLGWKVDGAFADALASLLETPVVLVRGAERFGSALAEMDAAALGALAAGTPQGAFQADLALPLPLPVLVPTTARYEGVAVSAFPSHPEVKFVLTADRGPMLQAIAALQQLAIAFTLLGGFIAFLVVFEIQRSVDRPLRQIMSHLSQYAQGASVGILPESALSGPFVRLGKQLNMILQAPAASGRGGAGVFAPTNPGVAYGADSLAPLAPAGAPVPSEPVGAVSSLPPPAPAASSSAISAAPIAPSLASSGISGIFAERSSDMLQGLPGASATLGGISVPSAAPVSSGISGSALPGAGALPGASLPGGAGLPGTPSLPPQAPVDDFNPEATAMFQVPQALLQEAARSGPPPAFSAPPPPPHQPEEARTVIAQIPTELLSQSATASGVSPAEESHFKEVYHEFLSTRARCNEDTDQLSYERFLTKLMKNRQQIIEKYNSKSVRFQVYVKQGKAALRAVPVRE
ncbi:MAG: MXAN_5187 C-terminal domain-containing protein [Myxococcota bacterium]